jgi:hypothetical protein
LVSLTLRKIAHFRSGNKASPSFAFQEDSKITKYQDLAAKQVAIIRGSKGDIAIGELVPTAERIKPPWPEPIISTPFCAVKKISGLKKARRQEQDLHYHLKHCIEG